VLLLHWSLLNYAVCVWDGLKLYVGVGRLCLVYDYDPTYKELYGGGVFFTDDVLLTQSAVRSMCRQWRRS
jgi:hypothetical protein